jgi:hypothetical protein
MDEPDHVLNVISKAINARLRLQKPLRDAKIGIATIYRILESESPVHSDALSKALTAYGLTIKVVPKKD